MDLHLIIFLLSASVVILITRICLKHWYNLVPRLPFREKWPPIALSLSHAVVVLLLVGLVIAYSLTDNEKAENNFEKIDKFIKDFETANDTVQNKSLAVTIPTFSLSSSRFHQSRTLVTTIEQKTGFDEVKTFSEQGVLADFAQLLLDIGDNTKCNLVDFGDLSLIETPMVQILTVVNNIINDINSLRQKYNKLEGHLDTLTNDLNTELVYEEPRMGNYSITIFRLFEDIVLSSKKAKAAAQEEIIRRNQEFFTRYKDTITIYVPTAFIVLINVVSILFNTPIKCAECCNCCNSKCLKDLRKKMPKMPKMPKKLSWCRIPVFFHIGFYLSLTIIAGLSGMHIYYVLKDDCPKQSLTLLNFTIKAFKSNNPNGTIYVNDALLNCSETNEKFFFARDSEIRISEPVFIRNYKRDFLTGSINTFKYGYEFDEDDLFNATEEAQNLYDKMDELNNKCSDADLKVEIETYRDALEKTKIYLNKTDKFKENLKTIETIVPPMIVTNLRGVNKTLYKPVIEIDKILSETDFDCRSVVEAFSKGLNPCKLVDEGFQSWTQIVVFFCCAISAILYLLAIRRIDTKQFKLENRHVWARRRVLEPVRPLDERQEMLPSVTFFKEELITDHNGKFRVSDYECIKATRVILRNRPDDFIHASWVRCPENKRSYIISQSPLKNTMTDFWAMCDQENVKTIVMLEVFVPDETECCAPYFPDKVDQTGTYENFQVTCIEVKSHPIEEVEWRVLQLVNSSDVNAKPRLINHVQILWWRDESDVPESPNQFIDLHRWVNKMNKGNSPICVHSRRGKIRSGTYVFFDYAYSRIQLDSLCTTEHMLESLQNMRKDAAADVKLVEFVERCMVIYIMQEGFLGNSETNDYFTDHSKRLYKKKSLKEVKKVENDVKTETVNEEPANE